MNYLLFENIDYINDYSYLPVVNIIYYVHTPKFLVDKHKSSYNYEDFPVNFVGGQN